MLPGSSCVDRLNDLGRNNQFLLDNEHAGVVAHGCAVVSSGRDSDQLVCSELVNGVKRVLMGSNNHADVVLLQEFVDDIRAVRHDVVVLLRISDGVLLHTKVLISHGGIRPQDVHAHLLDGVCNASKVHFEWSLDLVDVLKLDNRVANSTVDAKNAVLRSLFANYETERHPFEHIVHLLEHTVWIINILIEPLSALLSKSEVLVNTSILVISSQHENLLGILQLQCKKQANDLN